MRAIFGLVFIVGLALAGAAVFLAKSYLGQQEAATAFQSEVLRRTGGLIEVFVVNKPKRYGQTLATEDVQPILWPKNTLPAGAFSDKEKLFPPDNTAPRFVTRDMEAYEPVLAVKVTEPGAQAGLNGELSAGMRAFAIQVFASDFLQIGDHVDVYWSGTPDGSQASLTRLIENQMKVIAVDRIQDNQISDGSIMSRSVTVAATPEQVGRLAQAQSTGSLAMSLVGIGDQTQNPAIEIDNNELLGIKPAEAVPVAEQAAAPKVCTVRSRKGTEVVEIPIPCSN
jgi:pilus assembly protein CpaB